MRTRRRLLLHDLKAFLQVRDELPLLRASPERDSLLRWRAILCGPPNTPWELITLQLRIDFPPAYPSAPPVVICVTPVFHPNVDPHTGQICASVLTGREWTPRDGLMEVLITLQHAFLSNPNSGSAFNRHAAVLHDAQEPERPRLVRHDNAGASTPAGTPAAQYGRSHILGEGVSSASAEHGQLAGSSVRQQSQSCLCAYISAQRHPAGGATTTTATASSWTRDRESSSVCFSSGTMSYLSSHC